MALSRKAKAVIRFVLSVAFMLVMVIMAKVADDRSLVSIALAFTVILGIPVVLLSSIDLGRVLRMERGGNFLTTKMTWFLTQLQAAFGAICIAAGGYAAYYNLIDWVKGKGSLPWIWMVMGLMMTKVGFDYIRSVFAPKRESGQSESDA